MTSLLIGKKSSLESPGWLYHQPSEHKKSSPFFVSLRCSSACDPADHPLACMAPSSGGVE